MYLQMCVGHMARNVGRGSAYRGLVRRPGGKKPLGIFGHRCESNIKMHH